MNNKQNGGRLLEFRQRSANKHEFYKNTAGLRSGNSSDSDSACLKVVSYVKVFELRGTVNESERYWATTNGLKGPFTRAIFAAILVAIFSFWRM